MTTKSALDYLRQMPKSYLDLAMEYIVSKSEIYQMNTKCTSLPEALKRLNVWTPGKAREGYNFWAKVYYHYCGAGEPLPAIPRTNVALMMEAARSHVYHEGLGKAIVYKEILERLFEEMKPNRKIEQVFMRTILIKQLHECNITGLSLRNIGRIVAKLLTRREPFSHATVIHLIKSHDDLILSREKLYCGMYERFKQALANIESHLNRPVETESVEQFEPEFGC